MKVKPREPYYWTDSIYQVQLIFKGQEIQPGTLFKLKSDRTVYVFESMYYNKDLDVEWVNFRSQSNGEWKSVRPNKIMRLFIAKKSRTK